MKNDPWIGALTWVLGIAVLLAVVLDVAYVLAARRVQNLAPQVNNINQRKGLAVALRNDVFEYSKQHPDILEFIGGKAPPALPALPAKPANK